MQFDLVTDLVRFKLSAFFLVTGIGHSVLVRKILEIAFSGLIADRTIKWMV
jgi:hypothetical protein